MTLGAKIASFRRQLGLDIALTAQLAGVSVQQFDAWEKAENLSPYEFESACAALGATPSELLTGQIIDTRRSTVRFRTAMSDIGKFAAADVRLLARAAQLSRVLFGIMSAKMTHKLDKIRKNAFLLLNSEAWNQGYALGESTRKTLDPEHWKQPILDLDENVALLGINVGAVPFHTSGIEAASLVEPNAIPFILLNQKAGRVSYDVARRAIIAHELCHILYDRGEGDIGTRVSAQEQCGNYNSAIEQRARAFAPSYLAPPPAVHLWAATTLRSGSLARNRVEALAEYWGLSVEGAIWHAKNTKIISPDDAEQLFRERPLCRLDFSAFESQPSFQPLSMLHPELEDSFTSMLSPAFAVNIAEMAADGDIRLNQAKELLQWK